MFIALNILLFVCTFFCVISAEDVFWIPKEIVFIVGSLIIIGIAWMKEREFGYCFYNRWISWFFIYVVLYWALIFFKPLMLNEGAISLYNEQTKELLGSIPKVFPLIWWSFLPSFYVIISVIILKVLVEHTETLKQWESVIKSLCAICFIIACYAIFQYFGADQFLTIIAKDTPSAFSNNSHYMATTLGNKMVTTNFIAFLSPLFLVFPGKRYITGLGFTLFALILSRSALNLGAAIIGICVIFLLSGKWKLSLSILILLFISFICLKTTLNIKHSFITGANGRLGLWKETIGNCKKHLIIGQGLGSIWRDYTNVEKPIRWHSSHNLYLDILYQLGIVGLVMFLGIIGHSFKRIIYLFVGNKQNFILIGLTAGLVSYLIISIGGFPHLVAPTALVGILYLAGIEVCCSQRRRI